MAQIKNQQERKIRKSKAKACLFDAVSYNVFTHIMSLKWQKRYVIILRLIMKDMREMQVLNLVRDFDMQKMKDSETIKEYTERLLNIGNHVRLLGSTFNY